MAVYRVNKTKGFTVMANYHLQDITISLKAVGLLTKMLSFPDGWKFSTEGLAAICKEGPDAIQSALKELEQHGYLARRRLRDEKGRMTCTAFEIYEKPQAASPHEENPHMGKIQLWIIPTWIIHLWKTHTGKIRDNQILIKQILKNQILIQSITHHWAIGLMR